MLTEISNKIEKILKNGISSNLIIDAKNIYSEGWCQVLSRSKSGIEMLVQTDSEGNQEEIALKLHEGDVVCLNNNKPAEWDAASIATLLQAQDELKLPAKTIGEGKAYTRQGMIKRVLDERRERAAKALYKIKFANNIYGEHELVNEKGTKYYVLLRDFENETGYINNPDWQTNKLGTTKHIMFAFNKLKEDKKLYKNLAKTFPYVEIYTDPLNDYTITWHYPHPLPSRIETLIKKHFGDKKFIKAGHEKDFLLFIQSSEIYT